MRVSVRWGFDGRNACPGGGGNDCEAHRPGRYPGEQRGDGAERQAAWKYYGRKNRLRRLAAAVGDDARHGVSDDTGGFAVYEETKIRAGCEFDVSNRAACEQLRFRRLRGGQRRDGWVDARRGDRAWTGRHHD